MKLHSGIPGSIGVLLDAYQCYYVYLRHVQVGAVRICPRLDKHMSGNMWAYGVTHASTRDTTYKF